MTFSMLLAHLVGDYMIQSDWMATKKTKSFFVALIHAITYTLPFLFLTRDHRVLLVVCLTHAIIDRWRLAKYVCWMKNFLAPRWLKRCKCVDKNEHCHDCDLVRNWRWDQCADTGYGPDKPPWLSVWLLIITDNTMHLLCNAAAFMAWPS